MKTLKTLVVITLVLGVAASAQAIKVHQRLFMMTNTIEAAQSVGLVETNINDLTTAVTDGTVAIDTEGVMYIHHTGVWHRIAGGGDLSSATNQVLIDAKYYTDLATNAVGVTWDDRWVNQSGDTMSGSLDMGNNDISNVNFLAVRNLQAENETVLNIVVSNMAMVTTSLTVRGVLDMSGYNITNLAEATRGDMAVNYNQLTNQISSVEGDLVAATNQVLIDARTYTDAATNSVLNTSINYTDAATNAVYNQSVNYTDNATNGLMNDADARFVNITGDDMTGILGMGGNRITNVADAIAPQDAVTKAQLDAATNGLAGDVTLQKAYENGNTITTSAGEGDVTIAGTETLEVTTAGGAHISNDITVDGDSQIGGNETITGGLTVNGGDVEVNNGNNVTVETTGQIQVDGAGGGQINMDGNTGNESIRLNSSGKMVIYSGGQIALEFE